MKLNDILDRIETDLPQATDRLLELLRIPSISTDPAYKSDCDAAADHIVADLRSMGAEAEKRPTPGHPMVVGHIGEGAPHILFYGHYDVQPVDPLDLWDSPPFEPAVEDLPGGAVIRGRGACDDKGQLMTFIEALRAIIAVEGKPPCRITFFLEGEEESGSPSLVPFMEQHAEELKADITLICDTGMFDRDTPAISTMLRGLLAEEITVTGPSRDLHSGMYGGMARNPLHVLARTVAALHDDTGRVTLDGFYDDVAELPDQVRQQWQGLSFDHASFLGEVGLSQPAGEQDRTPLEMIWSRPTCEVNGMWGGYTGNGFKTVLPSQAHAKISFRLVSEQDPAKIHAAFVRHVEAHMPPDCTVTFGKGEGARASQMRIDDPAFEAARRALSDEWPNPAVYVGVGGSIPIAGYFQSMLGAEPMLIGFGLDDDKVHSPNEKYDMRSYRKGIRSWVRVLKALCETAR